MSAETPAWLQGLIASIPLWPLLAAVGIGLALATGWMRVHAHKLTVIGVGIAAALGITLFAVMAGQLSAHEPTVTADVEHAEEAQITEDHAAEPHAAAIYTYTIGHWISLGQLHTEHDQWIDINLSFDGLTSIMLLFVCFVSLMVVIYAVGYMKDHHGRPEPGYERFFAFLGLFVFSMCVLVMAGNFVLLYLGWEAVGLCSYLLIGFYFRKPEAAAAAKKAFLVNRIGDFGFALGIFAIYYVLVAQGNIHLHAGENPLDYATVFKYADQIAHQTIGGVNAATVISLLLFCGAIGKSAQFPLHVWLPDAMEGPTPVSALIHAATMVTAGVYMVARCGPLFMNADPFVLDIVLTVGVIGAVLAATMAMAQYDMKRILAYSTISQLAFMFVALGCAAPMSAIFHVFTHAFFKALLFLTAGSAMHAMGGVIDLRQFSGLKRTLPTTHKQMLIGCLALAGFPLLAGFWSKDEIVHAAFERSTLVGVIMLITAGLTAYYTFRMFFLCFNGPRRLPPQAGDHPHEMPAIMTGPLWILAAGAVLVGYLDVTFLGAPSKSFLGFLQPHGYFHDFLHNSTISSGHFENGTLVPGAKHDGGGAWLMYVSALVALAGIGLAYVRFGKAPEKDPDRALLGGLWKLWHRKYWFDEIYDHVFVRPLRALGNIFFGTDNNAVDGAVWFVSAVPRGMGFGLKFLQRGLLQSYALGMIIGVTILLLAWQWMASTPGS